MKRVIILVLDSFGIGASHDALAYGDHGADTFGHIAEYAAQGKADIPGVRSGPLQLPNLYQLGLGLAATASTGTIPPGSDPAVTTIGQYGYAVEQSVGKDTPSGHWEMTGLPVDYDWGYFPREYPSFPADLVQALITQAGLPGVLGNKHASGTDIIKELGDEHIATQRPIVYTSADSVFQIAAHEEYFGLERLYEICKVARKLVDPLHIGRVIARPFVGESGRYKRTANRKDYATPPHGPTLLDALIAAQREVLAVGKIGDIFAHRGVSQVFKGKDNMDLFDVTLNALRQAPTGSLVMTNFVDFDSQFGHRRDVPGYADALEAFDRRLPELLQQMSTDDVLIITADHGCDPTLPGSDHTREHIPVLVYGKTLPSKFLGRRDTFADIGQSVASYLGIAPLNYGISFLA